MLWALKVNQSPPNQSKLERNTNYERNLGPCDVGHLHVEAHVGDYGGAGGVAILAGCVRVQCVRGAILTPPRPPHPVHATAHQNLATSGINASRNKYLLEKIDAVPVRWAMAKSEQAALMARMGARA